MKKIISGTFLAILLLLNCLVSNAGSTQKVRIDWGKRSKECHGFGICDIYITFVLLETPAVRLADDGTLVLLVPFESVKGLEENFSGTTISIEESYEVPSEVLKSIGCPAPFIIKPGIYKLEKFKSGYAIYFTR